MNTTVETSVYTEKFLAETGRSFFEKVQNDFPDFEQAQAIEVALGCKKLQVNPTELWASLVSNPTQYKLLARTEWQTFKLTYGAGKESVSSFAKSLKQKITRLYFFANAYTMFDQYELTTIVKTLNESKEQVNQGDNMPEVCRNYICTSLLSRGSDFVEEFNNRIAYAPIVLEETQLQV